MPAKLNGARVVLTGTWFDRGFTISNGENFHNGIKYSNPTWKVDGAWPSDTAAEALVGRNVAGVAIGSTIDVGTLLKVVGILTTGGPEDDQIFVPLAIAQSLMAG